MSAFLSNIFMEATNLFVVIYRLLGGGRLKYWIAFIAMKPYTKYLNNFSTAKHLFEYRKLLFI